MQLMSGILESDAKDRQIYEDENIRVRCVNIASIIYKYADQLKVVET